jgi:hypothetical protein
VVSGFRRDVDESCTLMGGYEPLPCVSTQKGAEFNYLQAAGFAIPEVFALEEVLDLSNTAHTSRAGSSNP